jgi:hypothetical protein
MGPERRSIPQPMIGELCERTHKLFYTTTIADSRDTRAQPDSRGFLD